MDDFSIGMIVGAALTSAASVVYCAYVYHQLSKLSQRVDEQDKIITILDNIISQPTTRLPNRTMHDE